MDDDEVDALMIRGLALAAAVLVNLGAKVPQGEIIGQARDFETYLRGTPAT